MKKNNLKKYVILILLLSSFFYTFFSYVQKNFFQVSNHNLRFHFIDVGQGDSSLIITPKGKTILIDAGDEAHAKKVVSYIREQGIEKLDLVIATHPDADHIGGMDKVIKNFDIDVFAMPDVSAKTNQYKQIQRELKAKKMKATRLYQGDEVQIDDNIDFEILSPVKGKKYDDTNEYSIVAKIVYKDTSFILMGDATMENEVDIINNVPDIDIDVLKLGHHGSSTSSSDYFITPGSNEGTKKTWGNTISYRWDGRYRNNKWRQRDKIYQLNHFLYQYYYLSGIILYFNNSYSKATS